MDGALMKALHGKLSFLSDESFKTLLKYYKQGFLTSQEWSSLLNEITKHKDTWKAPRSPDLKNLIPPRETI